MSAYLSASSTVEALASQTTHPRETHHKDFWNLDDILSDEELVPCVFKIDGKGLGYLDQLQQLSSTASAQ